MKSVPYPTESVGEFSEDSERSPLMIDERPTLAIEKNRRHGTTAKEPPAGVLEGEQPGKGLAGWKNGKPCPKRRRVDAQTMIGRRELEFALRHGKTMLKERKQHPQCMVTPGDGGSRFDVPLSRRRPDHGQKVDVAHPHEESRRVDRADCRHIDDVVGQTESGERLRKPVEPPIDGSERSAG